MPKRVVIAGGGTGGHLYPGIALARALMKHDPEIEITFIGTERGIESRVLPKEGLRLKTIQSSGLIGKRGAGKLISWARLPIGLLQALGFLTAYRPQLVVGVGGYVSGPALAAARLLGKPTLIHEQNVQPGVANRILGKIVDRIAVNFEESRNFFPAEKVTVTGNMIREGFASATEPKKREASDPLRILILGGSQGAHSINLAVLDALPLLENQKTRLELVHQTGEKDLESVQQAYAAHGFNAKAEAFMHDMETRYREADLILCRAGATTLAEVTACGKPSILVPFPYAAHNHQEKNARVLEKDGAGTMVLDHELTGKVLAQLITSALDDPEPWNERARASYRLGKRDATERVKQICLELMDQKAA